jgi:hypothetical protein
MTGPGPRITRFKGDTFFLSNFYRSEVRMVGLVFPTAEHAYQALKTDDPERRLWIRCAGTPSIAKQRGRGVRLVPDWEYIKVKAMAQVLFEKFRDPALAERLVATHPRELVEGNDWHDQFWGDCRCARCHEPGRNMLGKLLMELRDKMSETRTAPSDYDDDPFVSDSYLRYNEAPDINDCVRCDGSGLDPDGPGNGFH